MPKAEHSKTLKNSHPGLKGPTLIERIQRQMDKRRNAIEKHRAKDGVLLREAMDPQTLEQGRYEGIAAALAILRSSSMQHEIDCSNERLGIE